LAKSRKNLKDPHSPALVDLGDLVRFHRKKSGLTQLELAQLAGVGKTAVFDLENSIKQPRLDTIASILAVLNVDVRFESQLMSAYEEHRRAQGKGPAT
jgi:transcriptional regulator with XRE-family HTH domain